MYENRRRVRRPKGKRLLRQRGELIERSFAHCYDTGGMRRTHLKKHSNILKRLLIYVAGANLGLLLRTMYGTGTPRSLQGLSVTLRFVFVLTGEYLRLKSGGSKRPRNLLVDLYRQLTSTTGC